LLGILARSKYLLAFRSFPLIARQGLTARPDRKRRKAGPHQHWTRRKEGKERKEGDFPPQVTK